MCFKQCCEKDKIYASEQNAGKAPYPSLSYAVVGRFKFADDVYGATALDYLSPSKRFFARR